MVVAHLCRLPSVTLLAISATGSRWHRLVVGLLMNDSILKQKAGEKLFGFFRKYAETYTSARLLVELSLGNVSKSPFSPESITELKNEVITRARSHGMELLRTESDRNDVPFDFRFMDLVLLGDYAQGVRVGPGIRIPRLPALFRRKRRWRLPEQTDPLEYLDEHPTCESI